MTRTILTAGACGILLSLVSIQPAAAQQNDTGWKLKLNGIAAQPLVSTGGDPAYGVGVGVEYRASRRLGVELSASTAEIEDEFTFGFFDDSVTIGTSLRTTPVLAQLNVHLTPDCRADLYLGPVAGRVMYGDFDVTVHSSIDGETETVRGSVKTGDDWAWGAHIGVDVPVGDRGLFFTAGATWLMTEVEIEDPEEGGTFSSGLDPLIAQIGFGYRF